MRDSEAARRRRRRSSLSSSLPGMSSTTSRPLADPSSRRATLTPAAARPSSSLSTRPSSFTSSPVRPTPFTHGQIAPDDAKRLAQLAVATANQNRTDSSGSGTVKKPGSEQDSTAQQRLQQVKAEGESFAAGRGLDDCLSSSDDDDEMLVVVPRPSSQQGTSIPPQPDSQPSQGSNPAPIPFAFSLVDLSASANITAAAANPPDDQTAPTAQGWV
jgi:hypothetical protein